jgi:hypothetical protein
MDVGPALQDLPNPAEGFRELIASAVLKENTQDVAADHWVHSVFEVGEEGLIALAPRLLATLA